MNQSRQDANPDLSIAPAALPEPVAEDASIVILGASGDLTSRKLIPALFRLWQQGYLSGRSPIVGVARREKSDESFRNELFEAFTRDGSLRTGNAETSEWNEFAKRIYYHRLDLTQAEDDCSLRERLEDIEQSSGVVGRRMVYLATAPSLFVPSLEAMSRAGLLSSLDENDGWVRVVVEKPFGHGLASARELSRRLSSLLREDQIYRIDHYLGKETVQNILLFRFGNSIFEPLLNRNHVDHVQITAAESQGMEHGRGGYYDRSGALRDMMQNHVLQLLCLVAMEPPSLFQAREIRDEKLKVLEALDPGDSKDVSKWVAAGQYTAGTIDGSPVSGYREEERIPSDSNRETFVSMNVRVENWRWAGVPFYLRTGKRLSQRVTEIAIQFKLPPLRLFSTVECEGDMCDLVGARPNRLIFRIQPRESISLSFSTKRPGMQYQIHPAAMDFSYKETFGRNLPAAYERLLLDVLRGDSTLFTRSDELEAAWKFVTPALDYLESGSVIPDPYPAGSWGPESANELLERTGRRWRTEMIEPS